MDATAVVAVIGAITTPLVAVAGFAFNQARARDDRETAHQIAQDSRAHDLELRRRERAYEDRKTAYQHALQWGLLLTQQVMLTDPVITFEGMPDPPRDMAREEYALMRVNLSAFGTKNVEDALEKVRLAQQQFHIRNSVIKALQNQGAPFPDGALEARDEQRELTFTAFEELGDAIKNELANL